MRPVDDLALRARNWFWYWLVRNTSGLSNTQLDRKCFGEQIARKRYFENIQLTASSPNTVAVLKGKKVLEIVGCWDAVDNQPSPYLPSTQAFSSHLWVFLGKRNLPADTYSEFIQKYIEERGWIRLHARELPLYVTFLGASEPAARPGVSTAYSGMLHKLVSEATPDALAVLIALFREAMLGIFLEQAVALKIALRTATHRMCQQHNMPNDISRLLRRMIDDRVLSNSWLTEEDWRRHTGTQRKAKISSRERVRQFRAWVEWYVNESRPLIQTGYGGCPIVPRSPRVDWVAKNKDTLNEAYQQLALVAQRSRMLQDIPVGLTEEPEKLTIIETPELMHALSRPKKRSAGFYDAMRPRLEMGDLLPAYED